MGLGAAILHYKYIKSALSIWVWLQPFLIVNMQRSEIIVGLGSAILPCPHVEIRNNHVFGLNHSSLSISRYQG
jgi:hypothetical protein